MSDLISRQAAIAYAISGRVRTLPTSEDGEDWIRTEEVRQSLLTMPSAEPERKKGRWIETDDGWDSTYYVCSECGCPWTLIDGSPEDNGMNFCPNCGADMRGEREPQ